MPPPNQLRELIRATMKRQKLTYDMVEEQAREAGARISKSSVHKLATDPELTRAPTREVLQGLAEGLDLPLVVVQRAALASLGWELETVLTDEEETLIASWQGMSERDRRTVLRMIDVIRRGENENGEGVDR